MLGSLLSSLFLCLRYGKYLKRFTGVLLSIIFMTLIMGSIQYASADHSLGGQGIFKDEDNVNVASSIDSKWLIHLQVVVRDAQDRLVSVSESTHGDYIPHEITDHIFDEYLGEKEIINIDKRTYERAQFVEINNVHEFDFTIDFLDILSMWKLEFCFKTNEHGNEQGISCVPVFQTITPDVVLEKNDTFTLHWTILREF